MIFKMTLLFVILLLNNVLQSYSIKKNLLSYELSRRQSEKCFDLTIEERVNNAEFIFSGTVREVRYNVDKKAQKASVEIKRIFKGQHKLTQLFLSEIRGRFLPIVHKVCTVEGLGLDGLCSSHTRVFDTWLFFTNPVDDKLQLNSSLVRLSVMSIASIESAVAGKPLTSPRPTFPEDTDSDECSDDHFCQYSEKCVRSAEGKFECRCLQECSLVGETVCGSDGVTYVNECFLNRTMCHAKKHIYVLNFGPCETRDPCATINCYYGSKCAVEENQPTCVCEDDRSCEAYDENEDINDVQSHYHKHEYNSVCGDDGVQYRNICELRNRQCIEQREINVKVYGLCDPCRDLNCKHGSTCTIHPDGDYASCVCAFDCINMGDYELCGSDGNMYRNECEMRWSACSKQEDVYHVHESYCATTTTEQPTTTPSPVPTMRSTTTTTSTTKSLIPTTTTTTTLTFRRTRATTTTTSTTTTKMYKIPKPTPPKTTSTTTTTTTTSTTKTVILCNGVQCLYGSSCVDGTCSCPENCPLDADDYNRLKIFEDEEDMEEAVCGTDGVLYRSECHLKLTACKQALPIYVHHYGDCDEGLPWLDSCETKTCLYGGTCEVMEENGKRIEKCICSLDCSDVRYEICGSDGNLYMNECYMRRSACRKQQDIYQIDPLYCEGVEEKHCDGFEIVRDGMTDEELLCRNDAPYEKCPADAYCHVIDQIGKCCHDQVLSGCETSEHGCCPDRSTSALGPQYFGCDLESIDVCHCNPVGSTSTECDAATNSCSCKQNVGGLKCDRCHSGFWGFPLIAEGQPGCHACNCNALGSFRSDCDQMTGRCLCKGHAMGDKCQYCLNGSWLTEQGCVAATTVGTTSRSVDISTRKTTPEPSKKTTKAIVDVNKKPKTTKSSKKMTTTSVVKTTTKKSKKITSKPKKSTTIKSITTPKYKKTTLAPTTSTTITLPPSTTPEDISSSSSYISPHFNGDSFIRLRNLVHGKHDVTISMKFLPLSLDGLLLYAGHLDKLKSGFLSIALKNGSVEFRFDLGSGPATLRSDETIKLNQLHTLSATRYGKDGLLKVDGGSNVVGVSRGSSRTLETDVPLFLGKIPHSDIVSKKNNHVDVGYVGCIESLNISSSLQNTAEYNLSKDPSFINTDIIMERKIYDCRDECIQMECLEEESDCFNRTKSFVCACPPDHHGLMCENAGEISVH